MSSLNKVTIIGRVGKDPEIRYTPTGDAIASFSIATSEKWKDKTTGEVKESTEWHNITAFRKLAEIIGKYVKKGSLLYIEGKLKTDKVSKDGVDRYFTKIIADEMKMLGAKSEGAAASPSQESHDMDDDIPF